MEISKCTWATRGVDTRDLKEEKGRAGAMIGINESDSGRRAAELRRGRG